jgi:hypothetical protein
MEFLTNNWWVILLVGGLFYFMFRSGGCGGHSRSGSHQGHDGATDSGSHQGHHQVADSGAAQKALEKTTRPSGRKRGGCC